MIQLNRCSALFILSLLIANHLCLAQTTASVAEIGDRIRVEQDLIHSFWREETTPKANYAINGRVLDPNGNPLSDATIAITALDISKNPTGLERHSRQRGVPPTELSLRKSTMSGGAFKLEGLKEGAGLITVIYPRQVPIVKSVIIPTSETLELKFENQPGGAIRGRVVNAITKLPVPGATVRAMASRPTSFTPGDSATTPSITLSAEVNAAHANDSGTFELTRLPAGQIYLTAENTDLFPIPNHPAQYPLEIENAQTTTAPDLQLYPAYTVIGTLTSAASGRPVAGASIRMGNVYYEAKDAKPAITDSQGSYTLKGVSPPTALLRQGKNPAVLPVTIHRLGYQPANVTLEIPLPVDLENLALTKDFQISPTAALTTATVTSP